MACWQDEIVQMLRVRINDLGATPTYSDRTLQLVICVAARDVVREIGGFDTSYSINIAIPSISPDPATGLDYDFTNLVSLKAACSLSRNLQHSKALQSIMIKDGPSNIDSRDVGKQIAAWADKVCGEYTEASLQYRLGSRLAGQAIVGPYQSDGANYGDSNRTYRDNYDGFYLN